MARFDQIEHACLTDVGVRRSHNQDNHAIQLAGDEEQWRQRGHLFLVADGMGAHAVGEKASEQAAAAIPHIFQKQAHHGPSSALRRSIIEANASIHACGKANREFEGMGTTATVLLLRPEGAWIAHVGDSRAYRVRDGTIEQLSYDHSLVWEYARRQGLDPDEVEDIPSNVILRCLGPEPSVQPDIEGPHPVQPGDIFVLCSDGLSGQVTDAQIGAVASVLPPAEACRFLVDLANMRGGPDNITVLIVRVGSRPGDNGIPQSSGPSLSRPARLVPPWWVVSLACGTLLVVGAVWLVTQQLPGKEAAFVAAAAAILAGLFGLFQHYRREQEHQEDDPQPVRIHRRSPCTIDRTLLDKLTRALHDLRQRIEERGWGPDWSAYQEHHADADRCLEKGDVRGAFREYCRAMLPLSRTLGEHRQKEEVFQPVWDKRD